MAKKKTYYDYLRQELGELVDQLHLPNLYKQSLKSRWLEQVVWADKKAADCRRLHYRLRLTTIIGGVILPALVGINFQIGDDNPALKKWFPYLPFALSQVIAVSAAVEEFCRYGDRWRDYRKMSEDLKAEGWQYLQSSGSYEISKTHVAGYPIFASRVESIIKDDVQNYISELVNQQAKQEQKIAQYLESAQSVTNDKTLFARPEPEISPAPEIAPVNDASADSVANPVPGAAGLIRVQQSTVFKFSTQPEEALPDNQKLAIAAGSAFGLQAYQDGGNQHLYITLSQGVGAYQQTVWYVFAPHVEVISNNDQVINPIPTAPTATIAAPSSIAAIQAAMAKLPVPAAPTTPKTSVQLQVPYLSQLDNVNNPFGSCNVTSLAMCLKYLNIPQKNPPQQYEDELYDYMENNGLARHEGPDLAEVVQLYGGQDRFSTTAKLDEVKQWLAQGFPCVVHGYFTDFGHIVCVIGYNEQGLVIHDPYGKWSGVKGQYDRNDDSNPEKGKAVTYSYESIKDSCIDEEFWVHFISKPGSQPATPTTIAQFQPAQTAIAKLQLATLSTLASTPLLITADQLIKIAEDCKPGASPLNRLRQLTSAFNQVLVKYQINTPLRIAHFIAQVAHESDSFNAMEEYASGEDYEGWAEELGNTEPGDGKRFKGRGLMQLTGRANYQQFSDAMGINFIAKPELVAQDPHAVIVAGWYWDTRKVNAPADQDDLVEVTLLINGGDNGLEDRRDYLQAAKRILNC